MATKMSTNMKALIAISGFYFAAMLAIACFRCLCYERGDSQTTIFSLRSPKHQALEEFGKAKQPFTEAYVISLDESKFNVFAQRNFDMASTTGDDDIQESSRARLEWFQGYDGMHNQSVLDEFSRLTNLPRVQLSDFSGANSHRIKDDYNSPHAVGCYLSHWRLLEQARNSWKAKNTSSTEQNPTKPDMLFVFEDDAHCVSNLIDRVWKVVQKLPKDWDILYIGGKPFSYHTMNYTLAELQGHQDEDIPRPPPQEINERICRGDFGASVTGPFPPGVTQEDSVQAAMGTNLANDPPYWRAKWVFNTHAYVVNPNRIQRVLRVLSEPKDQYLPVDVTLSYEFHREFISPWKYNSNNNNTESAANAPLKAYLTPYIYCDQESLRRIHNRNEPPDWEGFFWAPQRKASVYPDPYGFVWDKMANRGACANSLYGNNAQANKQ